MKALNITIYFASLFLLYISAGMGVAITLASVSLSVLYVWIVILEMISCRKSPSNLTKRLLLVNLAVIFASAFVVGLAGAVLLLVILLVLQGFVLLARYGLRKGPAVQDADLRLKYFGILLFGFFSLNPLIEGVSASNWIEAIASVILIFDGYLIFEEVKNTLISNATMGCFYTGISSRFDSNHVRIFCFIPTVLAIRCSNERDFNGHSVLLAKKS